MKKKKWTFEELREIALQYKTKGEFKKCHRKAYYASTHRNDYDLIVEHMPKYLNKLGKETLRTSWTDDKLKLAALQYNRRQDFIKGNRNAYFVALNKGQEFLDDICAHMKDPLTRAYSDEEIAIIALQYLSRSEFQAKSGGAANAARDRSVAFFDSVCSHMKLSDTSSCQERELFSIIKQKQPKVQKLRDSKVRIPNKPHIKGFDLDIYVPELCKGIEFDGKYWHSEAGLKRGRVNWPKEDILNYHKLKNDYFTSKGIQILHIREEDWIKNKEECIKKSLDFLEL